jgi:prepilin-type N-terminal cleavage/methylation domain-containing protein
MGFTLIEVMVGVLLMSIIIVAATGIWISCTRGWSFAERHQKETSQDDVAVRRVRELFERVLVEENSRKLYEWRCENQNDGSASADRIEFTTQWPFETGGGRTILAPVRGQLRLDSAPGNRAARRLVWKFAPFSSEFNPAGDGQTIVFGGDLDGFNIRYWWRDANRWVDDWREEGKWPEAVEVELTFLNPRDASKRQQRFIVAIERPAPARPGSLEEAQPPGEGEPAPEGSA